MRRVKSGDGQLGAGYGDAGFLLGFPCEAIALQARLNRGGEVANQLFVEIEIVDRVRDQFEIEPAAIGPYAGFQRRFTRALRGAAPAPSCASRECEAA